MKFFLKILITALIIFQNINIVAQVNKSQAANYQAQKTSFHDYASSYQKGYVLLLDGTRMAGEISIIGYSYEQLYGVNLKTPAGEKYKFALRSLFEFGLTDNLINDTPGEFSWYTVDKVKIGSNTGAPPKPSNTRKGSADYGYVVTKDGSTYHGKISIKEVRKKVTQIDVKTVNKQKYKFEAGQLSNFGAGQRSVTAAANQAEPTAAAKRTVYAVSDFQTWIINAGNEGVNGFVIDANGDRLMGELSISKSPDLWFIRYVTLTLPNGNVNYYSVRDALTKIVFIKNGELQEYINFEGEYVEVLDHEGSLVHFRNPHPTTLSTGGDLASAFAGAALESADQDLRKQGGSVTKNTNPDEDTDWTSEEVIMLYAKEYILLNESTDKYAMYIPGRNYRQIEGDLMGSMHYLMLPKEGKEALRKMDKPIRTMKYLNEKIYNR